MNIQQLEYIVAVDRFRHFAKAADACFVTQPTLSMMIQKLEEELDARIFDRSKHPVVPTPVGEMVIAQARITLKSLARVKEIVQEERDAFSGTFRIGVIPTVAPYFLPYFLPFFEERYPQVQLIITEMVTAQVIRDLSGGMIDGGVVATPLDEPGLAEHPLYYEDFFAYVSKKEEVYTKKSLLPTDIKPERLWLLEEGHCFRSQVLRYCDLRKQRSNPVTDSFIYEAGSIDTLVRLVDQRDGLTILPELAAAYLRPDQRKNLRRFSDPSPAREVSLVTREDFIRHRMIASFRDTAKNVLPSVMTRPELRKQDAISAR